MCNYPNCKIRPTYKVEGKKALYCAKHKEDGMVEANASSGMCVPISQPFTWRGSSFYEISFSLIFFYFFGVSFL